MHPLMAGTIYQLIHHTVRVMDQFDIQYVSDGGTTLGAVRHQGLIPHDDDGDFLVLPGYEDILESPDFQDALQERNLTIVKHWLGYKIFANTDHPLGRSHEKDGCRFKAPALDIYTTKYKDETKQTIVCLEDRARKTWPEMEFGTDEVGVNMPPRIVDFGPTKIHTHYDAESICKRIYGPDCLTHAYLQYDHINQRALPQVKVELTDFSPPAYEEWSELPGLGIQQSEL